LCGAWRLLASASDVPAVWSCRLLRQVKVQARPRAFPSNWPSLDPALQGAGHGLGVVLCRRGASRPDMTDVIDAGPTSDRHELMYWRGGRLDASHALYRLRAHPGRILIVFGAPIGFAITGFLHLVAAGDAPEIYTGLKGHAAYGLRSMLCSCCLSCCWRWRSTG
jgi:hypothetical protein